MSKNMSNRPSNVMRLVEKFALSTFVVCSFIAYGVHERFFSSDPSANALPPSNNPGAMQPTTPPVAQSGPASAPTHGAPTATPAPAGTATRGAPSSPKAAPSPTRVPPSPTPRPQGAYKDGSYTGSEADTFYGPVQVQAIIQNGRLTNVQFLEYPNDRRTSVRINSQAMPWLQTEAVRAQSASVNIITGATLTSEAFIESLQSALNSARAGM